MIMKEKGQKKSKKTSNLPIMLCFILIGAICGFVMADYVNHVFGDGLPTGKKLLFLFIAFIELSVCLLLQIILHEAGHLIAGLLSGYTFSSFRFGSLMWMKGENGIRLRKLTIAGTGGQCLMNPPELVDGKVPYVLYNLGGVLMNLVTVLLCAILLFFFHDVPFLSTFLSMMAVVGLGYALTNGIPMQSGMVNNDGYNAKELGNSPEAMRAFWLQLKIAEQTSRGIRLKDMPDQWFSLPDEDGMRNSMTAVMSVFHANRLMDEHAFAKAQTALDQILCSDAAIVGLHRNLLLCDRLYCELIQERTDDVIRKLYNKELQKFMKQMRSFPSVIRTEYAYALLFEKNDEQAAQIKKRFEQCGKTYPYSSDVESERELMMIAEEASRT